ncbi:DUF3784 domain-containing protein [Clostridium sp. C8-1-8]|uniref:DUF3784 domain-containing protein n=1 Tax=Clostridium sp. C8-1-8 TaxID=2698831 RepID=UPI00136A2C94|nr:DUF3784 domain-containing protein [Clostridium sp. C8-1-8]
MIIGIIILAILTALSLILISGKGGILLAGYNTLSKEEKEKYDEKKLCRNSGFELLAVDILLAVLLIYISTDFGKVHPLFAAIPIALIIIVFVFISVFKTEKDKEKFYKDQHKRRD